MKWNTWNSRDYRNLEILIPEEKRKKDSTIEYSVESRRASSRANFLDNRVCRDAHDSVPNYRSIFKCRDATLLSSITALGCNRTQVHGRALSTFHVTSFETRGSRLIERTVIDSCTERTRSDTCNNLKHGNALHIYIYIYIQPRDN